MWIIEVFKFGVYSLASSPAGFEGQEWMPAKSHHGQLSSCKRSGNWSTMPSPASLDFQSWMIPCDNIFPLVVANHSVSTKNASQHTMWRLLFVTSQFVNFSNTLYQPLLVRFWLGMLHWICSFWGAGQAWPRSKHTGSLLPNTLRGKSPCLGAESATGRPEDLYSGAVSEAFGGVVVLVFGPLQQQSYAMSVCKNANWTGLTLSMPPTCRCWAKMAPPASLDFQSWMTPRDNIFPLVAANHSVSTQNASQHTMWQLLFVTS